MNKTRLSLLAAALFCVVTAHAHAQSGCVSSPENPTAVLAVIGSAGAVFFSRRRL